MNSSNAAPPGFTIRIEREGFTRFSLNTSQLIPVAKDTAFHFFEDPRNLSDIIPDWVNFRVIDKGSDRVVRKNSEFNYTLTWLGIPLRWRSRITDYAPPDRFTDVQLKGPYRSWIHTHIIENGPRGTLMRDEISYAIPLIAVPVHALIIKKQLEAIFRHRAEKIADWARMKAAAHSHEK